MATACLGHPPPPPFLLIFLVFFLLTVQPAAAASSGQGGSRKDDDGGDGGGEGLGWGGGVASGGEELPVAKTRVVYPFRTDQYGHVISPYVNGFPRRPRHPRDTSEHPRRPRATLHPEDTSSRVQRATASPTLIGERELLEDWVQTVVEGDDDDEEEQQQQQQQQQQEEAGKGKVSDDGDKLYIMINNEDEELFLNLTANTRLVTPYTVIEWVLEGGRRVLKMASSSSSSCFYTGRLNTSSHSLVAVNNCDGLTGYIQTKDAGYFIEPLRRKGVPESGDDAASSPGPQPHLIYKVEAVTSRLNLSLQQDQEFQGREGEDEGEGEDSTSRNSSKKFGLSPSAPEDQEVNETKEEGEATVLEIIHGFNRNKRGTLSRLLSRGPGRKEEERKEEEEGALEWRTSSLSSNSRGRRRRRRRRRWSGRVPKFLRRPKFAPTTSERRGRSTNDQTEFDVIGERKHRRRRNQEEEETTVPQRSERQVVGVEEEVEERREARKNQDARNHVEDIENDNEEKGKRKRRKRQRKNGRNRACEPGPEGAAAAAAAAAAADESISERNGDDLSATNENGCKKPGERRQRIMEERARKREEKRKRREKRRMERERRKQEMRKRRRECREEKQEEEEEEEEGSGYRETCDVEQERREKRNRKREERQRRRKDNERKKRKRKGRKKVVEEERRGSQTEAASPTMADPFEALTLDGYSPDMWETQVAAGTSGLEEEEWKAPPQEEDAEKWLELVVAVDRSVIAFHGDEAVEGYVLTLFNIVSAIYEDPSLAANLHLVMLRIIFYKDAAQDQVREGQAKKSLEAVNRWAERLYRVSPEALRQDLGVWLTREDLGGPSGYAPVSGVCQPERSCTLNRDEGLTSAFIIAHEMAHALGLSHDGDAVAGNTCQQEAYQGSVMASLVVATFFRFHWSSCSRAEYHAKAKNWSCLRNKPRWQNATTVQSTIHYEYSLHDQCRLEFGDGYGLCSVMGTEDPCKHLWCSNSSTPQLCKTKKGPPLEGTACGDQKWCRHGVCVSVGQQFEVIGESPVRHNPRDGSWGAWGSWGPCSRTCGAGVSFRTRKCDKPTPAWGGRRCRGKREEWRVCGTEECPLPRIDLRAQQCSILSSIAQLDPRRASLTWLPYEPKRQRKRCRISCYSHATNEVYIGREFLVDGTSCSYDQPDDICVQGKCVALGCDKVVGSETRVDECGVCGGDGATCTRHHHTYSHTPPPEYSHVATLPAGAWNIEVKEEAPTMNFLALRDNSSASSSSSSSFFLNGDMTQEPSRTFIGEGAKFVYISHGERETLRARGPLLRPVSLLIHGTQALEQVTVTTTYVTQQRPEHHQWEVGPYTACSVTCGGGEQHQTLVCRDRRTDHQVFHDRCHHLPRPVLNTTTCNTFGCAARWVEGAWEHCSATCGPAGVQQRVVFCVTLPEANNAASWTQGIVDPNRCADTPRPEARRPCLRDPCPGAWTPQGWSECSSSCGEGVQSRVWECVGGGGNEVTYECGPQPRQERVCFRPPCPAVPCVRDASRFCQLPVLHRYCKVPEYRALCCHTCANVVY